MKKIFNLSNLIPFVVVFLFVTIFIIYFNINEKSKLNNDIYSKNLSVDDKIALVKEYRSSSNNKKASDLLLELVNDTYVLDTTKGQLYIQLAEIYKEYKEYDFAVGYYQKAIEYSDFDLLIQTTAKEALINLVIEYRLTEYFDYSENILMELIQSNKNKTEYYIKYSDFLILEENYKLAETNLLYVLSKDIKNSEAYKSLSYIYLVHENYDNAIKYLKKGIEYNYNDGELYNLLANAYKFSNNTNEAIKWFNKSKEYDKYIADNYFKLTDIYLSKNDKTDAINELNNLVKLFPDSSYSEQAEKQLSELVVKIYK